MVSTQTFLQKDACVKVERPCFCSAERLRIAGTEIKANVGLPIQSQGTVHSRTFWIETTHRSGACSTRGERVGNIHAEDWRKRPTGNQEFCATTDRVDTQ